MMLYKKGMITHLNVSLPDAESFIYFPNFDDLKTSPYHNTVTNQSTRHINEAYHIKREGFATH